jgi:uncharacterized protein GlcG (DUF336 family)
MVETTLADAAVPRASHVNVCVAIHDPRAHEMRLNRLSGSDTLTLTVSTSHVWFNLGSVGSDRAADAAAMERLAALATEAAVLLRRKEASAT